MGARKHDDVLSSLRRKGFKEEPGDHVILRYCNLEGQKTKFRTKLSHNKQDLNDHLISQMAKQCGLNKQQFLDLVDCPLSQEQYEEIIVKIN
jgi:hypothetical protein